jgi:hypothetical protein
MLPSVLELEDQKRALLRTISELRDLGPDSVTSIILRCGTPRCHCARPGDPGHGPNLRLTYTVHGKTITKALPAPVDLRKAEVEIAEFRKFQELSHAFVQVDERICRLRPAGDRLTPHKRTAEAAQREVAQEVGRLSEVIFTGCRKTGQLDLEAVETIVRALRPAPVGTRRVTNDPADRAIRPRRGRNWCRDAGRSS